MLHVLLKIVSSREDSDSSPNVKPTDGTPHSATNMHNATERCPGSYGHSCHQLIPRGTTRTDAPSHVPQAPMLSMSTEILYTCRPRTAC
jgi:hypothetical protein